MIGVDGVGGRLTDCCILTRAIGTGNNSFQQIGYNNRWKNIPLSKVFIMVIYGGLDIWMLTEFGIMGRLLKVTVDRRFTFGKRKIW
jgi:hypothetical protein